jgi:hypothetical protein
MLFAGGGHAALALAMLGAVARPVGGFVGFSDGRQEYTPTSG